MFLRVTTLQRPDRTRLTALAIMLLEEAAGEARRAPIRRTLAHRLALAWLGYASVAEPWQIAEFWTALAEVAIASHPSSQYCRDSRFDTLFRRWRFVAGIEGDHCRWRRELTCPGTPRSPA